VIAHAATVACRMVSENTQINVQMRHA